MTIMGLNTKDLPGCKDCGFPLQGISCEDKMQSTIIYKMKNRQM